ncbi:MAG TPA: helix-turn-helix domain-containing protein, partial [Ramlibacter sp.]
AAVAEARGNVMQAAQALGISRATIYRKLGKK